MKKKLLIALVLCLTYFLFGLYTLKDYNISWDEPTHFKRGQAYLWYFLTGEKSYQSLPPYNLFAAQTDPNYHTRSFYQNDTHNYSFWLTSAGGDHPPLNGILASLSNYIFYQKLGWIGDVEAYHLFGIFVSSLLVGTVFLFASKFNFWVGIYSVIFLATYPLFWGESHFNVKDPIETSFFALTIYFFWKSIVYKKSSQLFLSVLFAGLALSTKFNILFVSFIIGLWLLIRQFFLKLPTFQVIRSKRFIFILLIAPVIILSILILSWPYLWPNIPRNLLEVLKYYEGIGTEESFSNDYILGQWNFYALKWIILTTLPILLGAFVIGLISFLKWSKEKKDLLILWGLWFFVTIIRVTLPNMSIYGGVRQIMEYIPAMALIGGVGIYFIQQIISDWLPKKFKHTGSHVIGILFTLIIIISTFPILWRLHPNENVYFNNFNGGLKNAVDTGLPSAGNSFGNAYLPAIEWFNKNASKNSKLAFVQALNWNIPAYKIRSDIKYANSYWSGINREGEYLIDLTYNYNVKVYLYCWEYVEKLLDPVYELKVDGVPIVKIWKNDLAHTKVEYQKQEKPYQGKIETKVNGQILSIKLSEKTLLSRLMVEYRPTDDCLPIKDGVVRTSLDGKNWREEGDSLPIDQLGRQYQIAKNSLRYMFAAREAKYIEIETDNSNSCVLQDSQIKITMLE